MTDLINYIAMIKAELAKLPTNAMMSDRERYQKAVAAMVETLTEKLPKCRIVDKWNCTTVSIAGIRATSTGGIVGGLNNWIAAARRKLDGTGWIKTTGEKENVR